ncbi:hypothetical protein [Methanogenium organophilum]|uniref:Uncharacterized protein n=1 Tax=Methanogenium organophilum TaxID=2199 RepID=A0A9X9S2A1_METOG|nr:hypothetical protein [Methanogenium organophilum]WAI00494.1 hypothetical protein OU421_08635 [Methanogenium organophilum]
MVTDQGTDSGSGGGDGSDSIQRLFGRPFFLSLTIGVPFCIFKLLFGVTAVRIGLDAAQTPLVIFGWVVVIWAGLDLLMNGARSGFDLMERPSPLEYCTIAQVGRIARMPMVFLGIDTLLSFSIICGMLWSGWITTLTQTEAYLWYAATTLNLISLSVVSIYTEYRRLGR